MNSEYYGGKGKTRWHLWLSENAGKGYNVSDSAALYRAKYGLEYKKRIPSQCVRLSEDKCLPPDCFWKNKYTRKDGVNVKSHCSKFVGAFQPSKNPKPKSQIRRPPSECKGKDKSICSPPCSWIKEKKKTRKINKNTSPDEQKTNTNKT